MDGQPIAAGAIAAGAPDAAARVARVRADLTVRAGIEPRSIEVAPPEAALRAARP